MYLKPFKTFVKTTSFLALPALAYAQPNMPWDDGLLQIQRALTGTTAHIIIVIAIALGGIAFAIGEQGGIIKKAAAIIFGGSIATGAASLYMALKLSGGG